MQKKTKKIIPRPEILCIPTKLVSASDETTWNQKNATNYEYYSIHDHQKNINEISWHWSQIPEYVLYESGFIHDFNKLRMKRKNIYETEERYYNPIREYGLDGISFDGTTYHGIQSKLYEKTLTSNDLGTFYSAIFNRMKIKNPLSKGYLYHTCKLQIDLKDDIDNSTGNIVRKLLPYNETIQNDFMNSFSPIETVKSIDETKYELRPNQKEAVDALNQEWNGIKLLNLPCGTGKTVIFCNHVKEKRYKNIFILSPLKIHVRQNLERMKKFLPDYETLLLDSDVDGSTDIDDLTQILEKNSIISSTFDSAENVIQHLFEKNEDEEGEISYEPLVDISESIVIIDEAHNMIHKDELIQMIQSFPKVLLVTATPPSSMEEVIGSEVIYQYPFRRAIEEKYICDYQIYLPMLVQNTGILSVAIEKPIELSDCDEDMMKKCLYLANGMLQTGSRRCIVYLSSCEECEEFTIIWKKIMREYHYLPEWIHILTSEVSENDRQRIISEFEKESEDTLKIICSIRILNEGVDIPKCDSVFIANVGEHSSDITMVQRMCRANRLVKENPNKVANCFLWTDDLNKIVGSLSLLKENDIEFHKKIRVMNGDYDKQGDREMMDKIETENQKMNDFIRVKCMTYSDIWEMRRQMLFDFCDENGRIPEQREKYNDFNLGRWFCKSKYEIKSTSDMNYIKFSENIYVKRALDIYLKIIDIWEEKKNILFEFIEENGRTPYQGEFRYGIDLGGWYHHTKEKVKTNSDDLYIRLSENKIMKESLDKLFLERVKNKDKIKLTWNEWKELLFKFCDENKKAPKCKEIYNGLKLGGWLTEQKLKIDSTEHPLYKIFSENKYMKISLDNNLAIKEINKDKIKLSWDDWKKLLFEFCEMYNKHPSPKEEYKSVKLGSWYNDQKKKIHSNESDVYKKLSENKIAKKGLDIFLQNKIK